MLSSGCSGEEGLEGYPQPVFQEVQEVRYSGQRSRRFFRRQSREVFVLERGFPPCSYAEDELGKNVHCGQATLALPARKDGHDGLSRHARGLDEHGAADPPHPGRQESDSDGPGCRPQSAMLRALGRSPRAAGCQRKTAPATIKSFREVCAVNSRAVAAAMRLCQQKEAPTLSVAQRRVNIPWTCGRGPGEPRSTSIGNKGKASLNLNARFLLIWGSLATKAPS